MYVVYKQLPVLTVFTVVRSPLRKGIYKRKRKGAWSRRKEIPLVWQEPDTESEHGPGRAVFM